MAFRFEIRGTAEPSMKYSLKDMKEILWDMLSPMEDDEDFKFSLKFVKVTK